MLVSRGTSNRENVQIIKKHLLRNTRTRLKGSAPYRNDKNSLFHIKNLYGVTWCYRVRAYIYICIIYLLSVHIERDRESFPIGESAGKAYPFVFEIFVLGGMWGGQNSSNRRHQIFFGFILHVRDAPDIRPNDEVDVVHHESEHEEWWEKSGNIPELFLSLDL